jgi:ABC-type nickel/cobalt efflux system permease component RcnA
MLWWILQISSAGMMTGLGMWVCQWRELRPITFGGSAAESTNHTAEDAVGDEEMGHGRSRRGRGRDGAGEYEMVGLKGEVAEA